MTATTKELPEEIELCARCQAGLVFRQPGDGGGATHAYCPKCGAKEPGVLYIRKDVARHTARVLEALMDQCQRDLAPLKSFTLPGGGRINAFLHHARTVCRRAEREILTLSRGEVVSEWPLRYVNRLSDVFFVLSRWISKHDGEREYLWGRGLEAHRRTTDPGPTGPATPRVLTLNEGGRGRSGVGLDRSRSLEDGSKKEAAVRICSLLPSATDIVFALGLGDQLVAITHECDVPAGAPSVPVITKSTVAKARRNSRDIHNHVTAALHGGSSLYALDQDLLERLDPDLILTQELCEVCAISYQEVTAAVHRLEVRLPDQRRVLSLEPHRLGDILTIIEHVGQAAGVPERAQQLVHALQCQLEQITAVTRRVAARPRVYAMEWLDPPYTAGHWVPEMVRLAGGDDALATEGGLSVELSWEQIAHYDPEVLILMPCSFSLERTLEEWQALERPPRWSRLRAAQSGHVYAVNGAAYFSRSGPRTFEGLNILGEILHPDLFPRTTPDDAWRRVG